MDKLKEIWIAFQNGKGSPAIEWLRSNLTEAEVSELHAAVFPEPSDEEKESIIEQAARLLERVGKDGIAETVRREKPTKPDQGGGRYEGGPRK